MKLPNWIGRLLILVAVCAAGEVQAADDQGFWAAAGKPRVVLLMRHALAPGTGDPSNFELDDCATQRNLNEAGRRQAQAIGMAIRDAGVSVTGVFTSQWCRCRETAELLDLGAVRDLPALNSFYAGRGDRARQTAALRDFLKALPKDDKPVLVTHQVNITALTDVFPASGEVLAIELEDDGAVKVHARLRIDAR